MHMDSWHTQYSNNLSRIALRVVAADDIASLRFAVWVSIEGICCQNAFLVHRYIRRQPHTVARVYSFQSSLLPGIAHAVIVVPDVRHVCNEDRDTRVGTRIVKRLTHSPIASLHLVN